MTELGNLLRQIADIIDQNGGHIPAGLLNESARRIIAQPQPTKVPEKKKNLDMYKEHRQSIVRNFFLNQ